MHQEKQLAIFLANRPGTLAQVCAALAEKDVNILALTVSDTIDHAVVRMVVDRPMEATHLLGEAGMLVVESDVVVVDVENRPGALAELALKCADAGLNIEYAYCTAHSDQDKSMFVLRTRDIEKATTALK